MPNGHNNGTSKTTTSQTNNTSGEGNNTSQDKHWTDEETAKATDAAIEAKKAEDARAAKAEENSTANQLNKKLKEKGVMYTDENGNTQTVKIDIDSMIKQNKESRGKGLSEESNKLKDESNNVSFFLPSYGLNSFINERAVFQKQLYNIFGEPGWFYFKVFFNFGGSSGLLGGIPNMCLGAGEQPFEKSSAYKWLIANASRYPLYNLADRANSIEYFGKILAYICEKAPWFFIGINGLNKANMGNIAGSENQLDSRTIELVCNDEAVDMRLGTMLDLYRYAAYDEYDNKEILSENLRQFDMMIVVMNTPIKYYQSAMQVQNGAGTNLGGDRSNGLGKTLGVVDDVTRAIASADASTMGFKSIKGDYNDLTNNNGRVSFQMYTFKGCEIDPSSFSNYAHNINNSNFSKMGGSSIVIKYKKVYKHTCNEFYGLTLGPDGIYVNMQYSEEMRNRIKGSQNAVNNKTATTAGMPCKNIMDVSEMLIRDVNINVVHDPEFLGNIYDPLNHAPTGNIVDNIAQTGKKIRKNFKNYFKW